jgi:hypothetical protein
VPRIFQKGSLRKAEVTELLLGIVISTYIFGEKEKEIGLVAGYSNYNN